MGNLFSFTGFLTAVYSFYSKSQVPFAELSGHLSQKRATSAMNLCLRNDIHTSN